MLRRLFSSKKSSKTTESQKIDTPPEKPESKEAFDPYSSAPCIDDLDFQLDNGVKVKLTNENIEDIEADIVVVGNDGNLSNHAASAQSLLDAGGKEYAQSFSSLKSGLGDRQTAVLRCDAGSRLKCKKVYHAIFDAPYCRRDAQEWRASLDKLYNAACSMAREDGATSIALVLLGAGKAGGPTEDSVRAALATFSSLPASSSLSRLLVVERDERKMRDAVLECQKWTTEHPSPQH